MKNYATHPLFLFFYTVAVLIEGTTSLNSLPLKYSRFLTYWLTHSTFGWGFSKEEMTTVFCVTKAHKETLVVVMIK